MSQSPIDRVRLIRARTRRGLKVRQVAELAGYDSPASYSRLEHGYVKRPHPTQMSRLCEVLGVSED